MFEVGMPKSRDFLLALLPGFSERIHPGIFWSQDKQMVMIPEFSIPGFFALSFRISRDIPGFIFCSNGYILSLSNIKFSSLNANIMLCFRTFLSEHLFQNTCFKTHVSEHMFQSTCFWTTISEHLLQSKCFRTHISKLFWANCCLFFKIFNKVWKKLCFHDKIWKLHLYVKPNFPLK